MEAIQLDNVGHPHPYACGGIIVTPDPPQVGVPTTLALYLKNSGPKPVVVKRIEIMIARFGMGVAWEELPPPGPLNLPADPNHVEEVKVEWTPTQGGHRCVRAAIHTETLPRPLRVGRNLHVIESTEDRTRWQVPFRLGNPKNERLPVYLEVGGNDPGATEAHVIIAGRMLRPGQPVWLSPKEEVDAVLFIRARSDAALESVNTVEATIAGQFLDGIQVVVHRPARSTIRPFDLMGQGVVTSVPALSR